ncbi:YtxH domain-containing protein [Candidatus Enterococcus willemsii]|uniref:YtxH domain-containing protein n=1 Tax=Candidatus Enterococcus willemsii TaxID=1857215 RepID=A0ABQ6Z1J1_9ENTE|nr:YtxH domain-containing protein [Enterococcus sp. CU12B]KAF1304579.1 hypothetical protein BAU17_10280 [Enterococcus sp. CU12B]
MSNFIKGLAFGAAVGGASGLLFAPRSGKETQQMVETYIDDVTDATKEFNESLQNFQQAVRETQKTVQATAPIVSTSIKKSVEAFKFQAEPRVARINEQVEQLQNHIATLPVQSNEKNKK